MRARSCLCLSTARLIWNIVECDAQRIFFNIIQNGNEQTAMHLKIYFTKDVPSFFFFLWTNSDIRWMLFIFIPFFIHRIIYKIYFDKHIFCSCQRILSLLLILGYHILSEHSFSSTYKIYFQILRFDFLVSCEVHVVENQ